VAASKLFVHVKNNGNQIFYKGDNLEDSSYDNDVTIVKVTRNENLIAVIYLEPGESVGEYFDATEMKEKSKDVRST